MSSASPNRNSSGPARNIPIRRVQLSDPTQLPSDYSTTPGGTLFSTTPGGTRIIYDRKFLMEMRNSPLTKSPPPNLPKIPGVTCPDVQENGHEPRSTPQRPVGSEERKPGENGEEPQFAMDI